MHTKGEWKIEKRFEHGVFGHTVHIVSDDESHIAEIGPCAIEDNAKLIVAAPNLLEACEHILHALEHEGGGRIPEALEDVRTAINKAKGV